MGAYLAVIAVLVCGTAITAWRSGRNIKLVAGLGGLAGVLAVTVWMLRPDAGTGQADATTAWLVDSAVAFNTPGLPATQGPGGSAKVAGSLPELADRLAARLAKSPDDPNGWALLATTYHQLGREPEAQAAEQRAIEAGADPAALAKTHPLAMGSASGTAATSTRSTTQAAGALYVIEGQRLKVQRRFREAELEFRKAVETADSWADVADCAAAAAGNDLSAGREAIDRALAINPQHRKALWLRASLEVQEGRYATAAATWRTLSGQVPDDSPDARIIAANIVEADELAARAGG